MASLINAMRNISGDGMWIVKILLLSCPLFYLIDSEFGSGYPLGDRFTIMSFIFVLYMGVAAIMMNRNINNKSPILPGLFSVGEFIIKSICATVLILPQTVLIYAIVTYIYENIVLEPFVMFLIYSIVIIALSPFWFIPVVLYSVNGNFFDAFKFNVISQGSGNFSVQFMSFLLQYVIIFASIAAVIVILIKQMLGMDTVIMHACMSIIGTLTFFLFFSYCSDLYEDVIPPIKSKRDVV